LDREIRAWQIVDGGKEVSIIPVAFYCRETARHLGRGCSFMYTIYQSNIGFLNADFVASANLNTFYIPIIMRTLFWVELE